MKTALKSKKERLKERSLKQIEQKKEIEKEEQELISSHGMIERKSGDTYEYSLLVEDVDEEKKSGKKTLSAFHR